MTDLEAYPCPLCGRRDSRVLYEHRGRIVRCRGCGLVRRDPIPSGDELRSIYRASDYFRLRSANGIGYGDYFADEDVYRPYFRSHLALVARFRPPPGRLLEIGAAAGYALDEARAAGWSVRGLELSPEAVRSARDRFGVDVLEGGVDALDEEAAYDVIVAFQTLEHLADVRGALRAIRRALRPGGVLLLTTPDHDSVVRKLTRRFWVSYRPEHVLYFDRGTLSALLSEEGIPIELATADRSLRVPLARMVERASHYYGLPRPRLGPLGGWRVPVRLGDMVVIARRRA